MSDAFRTTVFLTLSGGFQDAYTYMGRGKVFANAQTGNIVLMATNFCEGGFAKSAAVSFAAAGLCRRCLFCRGHPQPLPPDGEIPLAQLILLIEIALLFVVGFIPNNLDWLANMLVSFVCAMQVQSFRKVHGNAYASTMCIGNMRSGMQYLYTGLHTKDRAVLRRAMQYFAVIALFAVGAAAGSLLTIHFGNRVIWFCCASLLVSLSFMFIREDIEENPELQREAAALHQDVKAMEHTIGKTLQEQQEELHPLNHK